MLQSTLDTEVFICKPTYFYNVSQRHNFLVYDFRPTESTQRVKCTMKVDTVTHFQALKRLETTAELQLWQKPSEIESERKLIAQLFQARKRNFSFFLPFNATDTFGLYLTDYLYKMEEDRILSSRGSLETKSQEEDLQDFLRVKLKTLFEVCREYREFGPREAVLRMQKPERQSPLLKTQQEEQFGIESENQLDNGKYINPVLSRYWSSTPDLLAYDVLVNKRRILCQDQEVQNIEVFEAMLHVISIFKKERFQEVYIMIEPATMMFKQYPMLDYALAKNKKKEFLDRTLPNEIVEGKLYLGNAEHAMNQEMLVSSFKITHIVNAAREVKSPIQGVEYLKVDICDEVTEEIFMHFEEVYQFIDSVWEQDECKVLVHCAQGRSRSAALVIMFLMRKNRWTLEFAKKYVTERREIVSVNDGFLDQLEKYEKNVLPNLKD